MFIADEAIETSHDEMEIPAGRVQSVMKDSKVVKNRHRERCRIWQVAWLMASNLPCAFVT